MRVTANDAAALLTLLAAASAATTVPAGDGLSLTVAADAATSALKYSLSLDGEPWLTSGPVALTLNGTTHSNARGCSPHCLTLASASPNTTSGADVQGAFRELVFSWLTGDGTGSNTGGGAGAPVLLTAFRVYASVAVVVFEQRFPGGVQGSALPTKDPRNSVSSAFPSWDMTASRGLSAWTSHAQSAGVAQWGGHAIGGGIEGGSPIVLFRPAAADGTGSRRSLVTSPLDNFMAGALESPCAALPGEYSAGGVLGSVTSIPAGYAHPTVVVGGLGVSDALMDWGDVLLRQGGKTRTMMDHPTDVSLTHIGYWTDHGAWYHYLCSECCVGTGAQNPCPCPPECAGHTTMEDVMLDVKADMERRGIPMQYFMFDSWWYPKEGDPSANSTHPWPVRSSEGMISWTPEPQVFQSGVAPWLGLPTFLHARYLAPGNVYRKIPALAKHLICEEDTPGPPSPPGPPIPPCHSSSYCAHPGVYCAGRDRQQLLEQSNVTLAACEALCTAHAACNCASWASEYPKTHAADCRLYADATALVKSVSGFGAYVKPSKGALSRGAAGQRFLPTSEGICLPVDESVFLHMMTGVAGWQPFVYEQDWISATFSKSLSLTNSTATGEAWLGSMDRAATRLNMTLQFSMSYTPAILQSSKMQALTQIRGSGDYSCGSDQWKVGDTAMLYWALGAVASKDTFYTEKHQPGCPDAGHYNCTEPNVEVQVIMATLAGGPVGPGDRLNLTNKELTMRSCNAAGRVLRTDRPLAVLDKGLDLGVTLWSSYSSVGVRDAQPWPEADGEAGPATSTAPPATSTAPPATFHTLFYQNSDPTNVTSADLFDICPNTSLAAMRCGPPSTAPLRTAAPDGVYTAAVITQTGGAWPPAHQTLQVVTKSSPLTLAPPPPPVGPDGDGVVPFQYVLLAPGGGSTGLGGSPWLVFGELDKVVPVSSQRFSGLVASPASLQWTLTGAAGEVVHVSWATVAAMELQTADCALGPDGAATFSCSVTGCGCR